MNQPSQLLSRARRQRDRAAPDRRGFQPPAPAPAAPREVGVRREERGVSKVIGQQSVPGQVLSQAVPGQTPPQAVPVPKQVTPPTTLAPEQVPSPAPVEPAARRTAKPAGHALYSQVMRSHDRMGTRHL